MPLQRRLEGFYASLGERESWKTRASVWMPMRYISSSSGETTLQTGKKEGKNITDSVLIPVYKWSCANTCCAWSSSCCWKVRQTTLLSGFGWFKKGHVFCFKIFKRKEEEHKVGLFNHCYELWRSRLVPLYYLSCSSAPLSDMVVNLLSVCTLMWNMRE